MRKFVISLAALAMTPLTSCSTEQMVDALVSDEEKAQVMGFVADVRAGNDEKSLAAIIPDIRAESAPALVAAKDFMQQVPAEYSIYAVNKSTNIDNGVSLGRKDYRLKSGSGTKWVNFDVVYMSKDGGPYQVAGWHVKPMAVDPETAQESESANETAPANAT